MLCDTKEYFEIEKSLQKLESLDDFYYPKLDYNKREERFKYKAFCLNNNFVDILKSVSRNQHEFLIRDLGSLQFNDYLLDTLGLTGLVESLRLHDSFRKKTMRLRKRIQHIIKDNDRCFFLTFTFDNSSMDRLSDKTKRRYVVRWLKKYCNDFVGNIDFGGQNGRVHFHAVVSLKASKVDNKTWEYGLFNFKRITSKNSKRLALYVNKLCSHALKESTKCQYLIYPKRT